MYVQRDTEVRSSNHSCSGKAISITYPEYVFAALGIQHEMRMRHIVNCGLSGSPTFFCIIPPTARFSRERKKLLNKKCVLIYSTTYV